MTTQTPVDIGTFIVRDPAIRRGRPMVAGSRVPVQTIAAWYIRGDSIDEIIASFPHLGPVKVFAALSYYFANREEIDADMETDRLWGEKMAHKYPNGIVGPIPDEDLP